MMTDIDLSGNAIDETGLNHLGEILPDTTRLNLRGNSFERSRVTDGLCDALKKAPHLKEIDLSVSGLPWKALCRTLGNMALTKLILRKLQTVEIGRNDRIWEWCHLVLKNKHLQHLDLSGNKALRVPAAFITTLKQSGSLRHLGLNQCLLSREDNFNLLEAIGTHSSLQAAFLADMALASNDYAQVADHLLSSRCRLKAIDLSLSPPTDSLPAPETVDKNCGSRWFQSLEDNTTIKFLNMRGRRIDEKKQQPLIKALQKNQTLQELNLSGCNFKPETLLAAVQGSTSLLRLQAQFEDCAAEIHVKIEEHLKQNYERDRRRELSKNEAVLIHKLLPIGIPFDLAQEITRWSWEIGGDDTVWNMAQVGYLRKLEEEERRSTQSSRKKI